MKRVCLLCLSLLSVLCGMAQTENTYRPFVEEGKVWKVGQLTGDWSTAYVLCYYYFEGDTLIGGETYKRWMCCEESRNGRTVSYAGALREEEKRVFAVPPTQEKAEVIYDFISSPGASLHLFDYLFGVGTGDYTLTNVATLENQGRRLRTLTIRREGQDEHLWVEGVGALNGPVCNLYLPVGYNRVLMRCSVGDNVLYEDGGIADALPRLSASPASLAQPCDLSGRPWASSRRGIAVSGGRKVLFR